VRLIETINELEEEAQLSKILILTWRTMGLKGAISKLERKNIEISR